MALAQVGFHVQQGSQIQDKAGDSGSPYFFSLWQRTERHLHAGIALHSLGWTGQTRKIEKHERRLGCATSSGIALCLSWRA